MTDHLPKDRLDPKLLRAVEKAEKQDNYSYGVHFHGRRECFAHVSFYPSRTWWLTYRDNGERVPLTRELADQIHRLRL